MAIDRGMVATATDAAWMGAAIEAAAAAGERGEIPVGAVVVAVDRQLASAGNASVCLSDPTGHAEVLALRAAARAIGNYRLPGVTLYSTVEPCAMCVGAMIHARVERLVCGCLDPKAGAAGSVVDLARSQRLNHRLDVTVGVREAECRALLQRFFSERRGRDHIRRSA